MSLNPVPISLAAALYAASAAAQTTQLTLIRAPVSAVAIGPTTAQVLINTHPGDHTVLVRRPLMAIAAPLVPVRIRVN